MHDVQNQGLERRGRVEFLKLQSFRNTIMVFKTKKFVASNTSWCSKTYVFQNLQNHGIFLKLQKYFASKQGLNCKPGNTNVLVLQLSICQHMRTYVNSNITDT